jgi:hypothetical protein
VKCDYFERGDGLSCRNIQLPMVEKVSIKQQQLTDLFYMFSHTDHFEVLVMLEHV